MLVNKNLPKSNQPAVLPITALLCDSYITGYLFHTVIFIGRCMITTAIAYIFHDVNKNSITVMATFFFVNVNICLTNSDKLLPS